VCSSRAGTSESRNDPGGAGSHSMGQVRQRIELICAGFRWQSAMTVVRRELPLSRSATRPGRENPASQS
jgi:hypothetical protein